MDVQQSPGWTMRREQPGQGGTSAPNSHGQPAQAYEKPAQSQRMHTSFISLLDTLGSAVRHIVGFGGRCRNLHGREAVNVPILVARKIYRSFNSSLLNRRPTSTCCKRFISSSKFWALPALQSNCTSNLRNTSHRILCRNNPIAKTLFLDSFHLRSGSRQCAPRAANALSKVISLPPEASAKASSQASAQTLGDAVKWQDFSRKSLSIGTGSFRKITRSS